jgi:uncharacterized membrane protein HdeD (DUF308 family)
MATQSVTGSVKGATGMLIGLAVVMILAGFLAVLLPFATGIGISILVAWVIVIGGFAYLVHAFAARSAGGFLWRTLVGIAYVVFGVYLLLHPTLALESLTLVLAAIFLAEGVLELVVFFQFRSRSGSGWMLFNALVTLLLAYLIWRPWPGSSTWAIGIIVGVNLIFSGFTRLMYSVAVRRAAQAIA